MDTNQSTIPALPDPTDVMNDYMQDLTSDELKVLVKKLAWNRGFGCFTRTGFEEVVWPCIKDQAKWIVYLDIDGMHSLNADFDTYEPVNKMIHEILEITRDTDVKAGQLNSGDEILIVLLETNMRPDMSVDAPQRLVGRLVESFSQKNMSATFAIVPVISEDLMKNLEPAVEQVHNIKIKRGWTPRSQ